MAFVAAAIYAGIAVFQWYAILEGNSLTDQAMKNARRANARAFDVAHAANGISQQANAEAKRIGDAANQISRDALISVQRALVAFVGQGSYTKLPIGKKTESVRLTLPWMNSGNTATRNGDSEVNWQWLPTELPEKFNFPDHPNIEHAKFVITPKAYGNATLIIPIGFMDATRKGDGHMFVWGWITYHDIFNGTPVRLSEFCDEITDITSSTADITDPSATISSQFTLCKEHNCTDEECSDYKEKTRGK